jgi:hypothetical protein
MQDSSNRKTTIAPLGLDQYEEQKFWRIGVTFGDTENPEGVWYWDSAEAAQIARREALLNGGREELPSITTITAEQASEYARSVGAKRVEVVNMDCEVVEWWLV